MNSSHLNKRMVNGVSWTATSQVVTQVVTFAATVVLARLLAPAQFGIVGMAALFTGLVTILGEIGLGAALIHRQDVSDAELNTVFWSGLGVGTIAFGLSLLFAPVAGWFFRNDAVVAVIRVYAMVFVVDALGAVQRVLLTKEMRFDRLARIEIAAAVAYGVAAVALALAGAGVWAIVIGQIVRSGAESALLWFFESWRPRLEFSREAFKRLFGFGASVWAFNFVNYGRENVDNLAVGRMLGAASLGLYAFAYNTSSLPRRQLMNVVGRVTFPAFASVKDDDALLRRTYIKVVRYTSLVAFPALVGLALVAPEFIPVVYGSKWNAAIVPLQLLCGAGMLYSIGSTVGSIYLAKGRPDIQFWGGVAVLPILAIIVIVATRWGIVGVATGILVYAITTLLISQSLANPLIGLPMLTFLRALVPATSACLVMATAVTVFRYFTLSRGVIGPVVFLVIAIVLGAAVYLGVLVGFRVEEFGEVVATFRGKIKPAAGGPVVVEAAAWTPGSDPKAGESS